MAVRFGPAVAGLFGLVEYFVSGYSPWLWSWLLVPVSWALLAGLRRLEGDVTFEHFRRPWTTLPDGVRFGDEQHSVAFGERQIAITEPESTWLIATSQVGSVRIIVPTFPAGLGLLCSLLGCYSNRQGPLVEVFVDDRFGNTHAHRSQSVRYDWRIQFCIDEAVRVLGWQAALSEPGLLDYVHGEVLQGSVLGRPIGSVRVPVLAMLLGGKGGYDGLIRQRIAEIKGE